MIETVLQLTSSERVADDIFRFRLKHDGALPAIKGGQFLHIEVPGKTLRRPICILSHDGDSVEIIFAVVGEGTKTLSQLPIGTTLKTILPIGNGFPEVKKGSKVLLIGGGLGAAPLFSTITNQAEFYSVLGFNTKSKVILEKDYLKKSKQFNITTDDGSYGTKGFVTTVAAESIAKLKPDMIFVCGSHPMLKALKEVLPQNIPTYVTMEARMGCGVGACLVCACPVKKGEVINNVRVCVDGPVFLFKDVVL